MRIGFRFSFGPLVAYVPLTGRTRRRAGRTTHAAAGLTSLLTLLARGAWVLVWVTLTWPYLTARWAGGQLGWTRERAVLTGLASTGAWWALAVLIDTLT